MYLCSRLEAFIIPTTLGMAIWISWRGKDEMWHVQEIVCIIPIKTRLKRVGHKRSSVHLSLAEPTLSTTTSPGKGMVASPSPSPPSPTVSFSSGTTTPLITQLRAGSMGRWHELHCTIIHRIVSRRRFEECMTRGITADS